MEVLIQGRTYHVIVALVASLMLVTPLGAAAQRTMKGQHAIGAGVSTSVTDFSDLGLCLNYSQYLLNAYWFAGASAADNDIRTDKGVLMEYADCYLGGGYMHRLASPRSRSISLYAGGGAFIGYEFYDPRKDLPANIETNLPTGTFLYGLSPMIEAEFFIIKRLALTLGGCFHLTFSSPLVILRPQLRLGVRFDI